MPKAVVLLSGGIDSTTCLAKAVKDFGAENVTALSIYYGQKHEREVLSAQQVANYYKVKQIKKDLTDVFSLSDCPLLKGRQNIEHKSYVDQIRENGHGTVKTYVPFRNGLFLSYASAIALSIGASFIFYGAHADDAAGSAYPDCTVDFARSMSHAMTEGSGGILHLVAPLINMTKAQVVRVGLELNAPYQLTWSCYEGDYKPCGACGTCIDRAAAFAANEVADPALKGI